LKAGILERYYVREAVIKVYESDKAGCGKSIRRGESYLNGASLVNQTPATIFIVRRDHGC
jgi:hypothetical protein